MQPQSEVNINKDMLLMNIAIPAIYVDKQLNITYVSKAVNDCFNKLQIDVGRPISSFAKTMFNDDILEDIRMALETNVRIEKVVSEGDKWYQMNAVTATNGSQNIEGVVITFIDVTNTVKRFNCNDNTEQLQEANRQLESFSASVSHDLRAPLRAIDGYAKIFIEEYGDKVDDKALELINGIGESTKKMQSLIRAMLSFAKYGKQAVHKEHVDMVKVINNIIPTLNSENIAKIQISSLYEGYADEPLITQVWTNLISNAIKYSRKKANPLIEIGSSIEGESVVYSIKDNGAGFNMKYADKLFNLFQRLHGNSEFEGTGIGLANVHQIIKKHGGKVWAEGVVGQGATFYFSLPIDK